MSYSAIYENTVEIISIYGDKALVKYKAQTMFQLSFYILAT